MKKLLILALITAPMFASAQSDTVKKWHDKYDDAFVLFFYKSSLEMLNMKDDEEFKALIKDIEKMKVLRIDKAKDKFSNEDYKALISDYKDEDFEELMSMKSDGSKINAYIKEKDGETKGVALLINDTNGVTILDLKGKIPLDKIGAFAQQMSSLEDLDFDFN